MTRRGLLLAAVASVGAGAAAGFGAGAGTAAPALLSAAAPGDDADGEGPLRFAHAYGETVLPRPARRVVSLGYDTQDALLALGVVPVAIRYWYGSYPHGVWPWAQDRLGSAAPALIVGEVSMEKVAALRPDLIVGIGAGLSRNEYRILSQIAPVLMQGRGYGTYGMPWDEVTVTLGRATGHEPLAHRLVADVKARFADARARRPGWAGQTAVAAYHSAGETGVFTGMDNRAQFLDALGFRPPEKIRHLTSPDGFYAQLSPEDLSPLDADLLLWISTFGGAADLAALPMRHTLRAWRQGREVYADALTSGALSFGSVLSLPFALRRLEGEMALALDGDPETRVPSAVAAGLAP